MGNAIATADWACTRLRVFVVLQRERQSCIRFINRNVEGVHARESLARSEPRHEMSSSFTAR
jgi:hypothetical protein